jgi:phage terminase large subunit-like protein
MDPLTDEPRKPRGGGDTRSQQARSEAARRQEQVVALRLRGVKFAAIGRTLDISKQSAQKIFARALRSNVTEDLESYHRRQVAELELERERVWQIAEAADKRDSKVQLACIRAMDRIHTRIARLLGLDASQQLDVQKIYNTGDEKASAARLARELVYENMPRDEQEFIYDSIYRASKLSATVDLQEKSTNGSAKRQLAAGTVRDQDELLPTEHDPTIDSGSITHRARFEHRFLAPRQGGLPLGKKVLVVIQSWNIASKEKESKVWTCTTWALVGDDACFYMVDWFRQSMDYVEGRQKVEELSARWKPYAILIEDIGSGATIISDLRATDVPVIPISPTESDKEANASAAFSILEKGWVLLPKYAEWPDAYIESLMRCTLTQRNCDFDSTGQALELLQKGPRGVKEHIENELGKYLCAYPKCNTGPRFRRKKLDSDMVILDARGNRYCSQFCQFSMP